MQNINKSMEELASLLELPLQELNRQSNTLLGNLGLDSLTATRLRGALFSTPSYQVLYGLTVAQVATKLSQAEDRKVLVRDKVIQHNNKHDAFALTPMQESYVIGANQECPCQVYTEFDVEHLDSAIFQKAVCLVIDRHPMLHAAIVDGTQQIISPRAEHRGLANLKVEQVADLNKRRQECMEAFKAQPDLYWDIRLSRLGENTVRIHLLLDMLFIDATSAMLLFQEVADHYQNLLLQGTPAMPSTRSHLEFRDYCIQLGTKKISDASLAYWMARCEWMPGPPQLPRLKQTSDQGVNFQRESITLSAEHWRALKAQACELKVTPNAILLAAFSEVLRLYTEDPDFSVAVTMSERPIGRDNDFSGVVGEFTNILLCSIKTHYGDSIAERAVAIHHELSDGLEHSDVSGLEVVRMLRKHRADPHLSFPIVFTSFLGIVRSDLSLANCSVDLHFQQTQTPQITLDHQVYEWKGELKVNWDYDNNFYAQGLMSEMLGCFQHLLEHLAIGTSHPNILPSEVLETRLKMNETSHNFDSENPLLLHELVLQTAYRTPSATAVIDQDVVLTYSEVVDMARAVAACLQNAGVGPDSCVAIVMEKGWEQVVATIGILLTGAFYLPLNPSHPDDRLRSILSLAKCTVALVQNKTIAVGRNWHYIKDGVFITTICVDRDLVNTVAKSDPLLVKVDPDQLAYLIFTSGSTGEPKGVEITHRGAVNTCLDINQRFGLQAETITFAISSLSFDLSVWDIFGTLAAGGTVVVCKPDGTRDPDYWWQQLEQHGITVWNTVPTSFEMLIASRPPGITLPLKTVFLSGDAISMNLVENALSLFPALQIVCMGGATEASIWSNFHVVTSSSRDLGTELVPYGKALSNQTIHVLDSHFGYRPTGVVGDIYIGGVGLARGYFHDPVLTNSKFIHREPFGRLYVTGDLGRYLPNGEIEIIGRKDSQVKVGGHRVELAEIEHCVGQLPFVLHAAVVHLSNAGTRLVGFVTVNDDIEELEEKLRTQVDQHLPDYMAPQSWMVLKEIPLTPNSKVDTRKLRQLAMSSLQHKQVNQPVEEGSSEVALILQLAAQVLKVPANSLSATHSLVEQGLSSLFSVQLVNLLSEAWNTRLPYTLIFNYPSAVQLAAYRSGRRSNNSSKSVLKEHSVEPIAIIGAACRLPGNVSSPKEFWEMLLASTDCMTDVPSSRFDINEVYDANPNAVDRSYTRRGAFMDRVESFDHDFFDISAAEAYTIDPQQRMLLEVAYEAFYTAGYDKDRLRGSSTGIFVGQMNYDWLTDFGHIADYAGTGASPSITSNRISFTLDLAGPSMTIDTACSSSLVAVDAAVTKLRSGACRMALAGGVNIILCAQPYVTTSQARMLSIDGRCATFDIAANGIARGEGVGAVILKRLSDALADGDPILALIRGTAVNQDGRSASLTAPSGAAQEEVIKQALAFAGLAGRDVDYIECHGTGTPLGDPIEIEALKNVLGEQREKPLVLGAVKTNIGHLEGAAGIIGLIKTIEVLRHREAPGNLHFKTLNPKIDLHGFAAVIPTKPTLLGDIGSKRSLVASVSSFGFGGTNAHAVLESWEATQEVSSATALSSGVSKNIVSELFRYVPLIWNKPVAKQAINKLNQHKFEQITEQTTSTNFVYETVWVPAPSPSPTKSVNDMVNPCLLLSRVAINCELPAGWQNFVISDATSLLSILSKDRWFTVALVGTNSEVDIELGLNLLQFVGKHTALQIEQIIFVTAPQNDTDAGLWGLARTFRLEYPNIRVCCIECVDGMLPKAISLVSSYVAEDEFSINEEDVVYVPRLRLCDGVSSTKPLSIRPDATYVISGGQGALGLVAAKLLVECGAKYLLLLSRTLKPSNSVLQEISVLRRHATVECFACDVSQEKDVLQARDWLLQNHWPNVRGVIHAAGVLTDGIIPNQSANKLRMAFGPKVHGACHLRAVFTSPDFLVLFSSVASTFGSAGQGSYVAANATLDALARTWSSAGEPVLSIQWGAWSDAGMAVRHDAVKRIEAAGFGTLSNALGTRMLEQLLAAGKYGTVCVSPIDWNRLAIKGPRLEALLDTHSAAVPQTWSRAAIQQLVQECIRQFIPLADMGDNCSFMEAGFSSLDLVQFRQQLLSRLPDSIDLPVHFAFNYPTEQDVTNYLFEQLKVEPVQSEDTTAIWTLLNGQTSGTPLFLISGVMGSVEKTFGTLAAAMSVPVYAAKPAIPAVIDPSQISLESVAAALKEAMLREIPCDTYTIGGLSFGATLAFEIGVQLERDKKLSRIVMLDPRHMPPFIAPKDPAPFELLLAHYTPAATIDAPVLVFQCTIPPIKRQSEMMKEASRSFQDDVPVLERCRALCPSLELIRNDGHHFNFLFKHFEPIATRIEQDLKKEAVQEASLTGYSVEPIAIVGMACRLPGNVTSPAELWEMLLAGTDCVSDIPTSRFDIDEVYDPNLDAVGRSYTRRGAFMSQVEYFDHDFFGISMAEARAMDPQQRLLLEVAYEAFHQAGYDKKSLRGSATSVHIGLANDDWTTMGRDHEAHSPHFGAGVSGSIASNRISYLLGLTGPSMTLDTACSSSLVAVDLAVEKLRSGICSLALVGGVNVMLHHRMFVSACATKALSVEGRCATFDESADGYCRGEGVGAIVLKRLNDALDADDVVLAVIRGTAVNQDGRSVSMTAPNGLAQEAVIRQALDVAGLEGRDVDYVECHGTGTPLGDPIEVASIKNVLGSQREKPIVLGAVKTNIGHLEGAAGIIGLIKTVEVLRHRAAPKNAHFKNLNPKIDLQNFNVIIPTQLTSLGGDADSSLVAGVSSFGFGGTNAHVVLESYDAEASEPKPHIVYAPRFLPWHRLPHPLLSHKEDIGFSTMLCGEQAKMWQDHRIGGQVLIPAASHITMLGGAALLKQGRTIKTFGVEVNDVIMLRPLVVSGGDTIIRCIPEGNQWSVQTERNIISEQFASCRSTRILTSNDQKRSDIDIPAVCSRCPSADVDALYHILSNHGVQFGPSYRNLVDLHLGEEEAISRIQINLSSTVDRSLTLLHPATLDAGIQLLGLCGMKTSGVCVPFNVRCARLFYLEDQPNKLWAYARITASSSKSVEGTVTLFAETGEIFAILEGLTCRQAGVDSQVNEALFETEWITPALVSPIINQAKQYLLLSSVTVNNEFPDGWQNCVVNSESVENTLLPLLSHNRESTIVLLGMGTESDVSLGLRLLQWVNENPSLQIDQIVFVTAPVSEADAGLWGLARTFRLERPDIRLRCLECVTDNIPNAISLISGYTAEDEFSVDREGVVRVPRLRRCNDIGVGEPLIIRSDATYVISGGQGALGLVVAKLLVDCGAKHLLLLSRTPKEPDSLPPEILGLREYAQIECLACDVSQETSVVQIRGWLSRNHWPTVRGVVHTAGILTDGTIPNQSADKLRLAFGAKVHGARNLRAVFNPPDFLILFSSAAATFGSAGQGSYAAANAALDALAQAWSLAGEPVLSIQWGAWSDAGMAVRHDAVKRAEAAGFGAISNVLGAQVLEQLLVMGKRGTVCVSPIDWNRFSLGTPLVSRFYHKRIPATVQHVESRAHNLADLLVLVRRAAVQAVGRPVADDDPLMANGLDSLGAVVLAQTLSQELDLSLGSVFALNYPTIEEMAEALIPLLKKSTIPAVVAAPPHPRLQGSEEPIAIVGAACRLPGNVTSTEEFWDMLLAGTDCVTDIPLSRFDIDEVYDANPDAVGRSYTRRGAFMGQVENFDHHFFGISLAEARVMDPHQRLLLEVSYEAFHNAGYDKKRLRGSSTGVFVGVANQDWMIVCGDNEAQNPFFGAGVSSSITSNRISHLLGFTGPSMTLDTACSSSLVAVDLAVEKLRSGVCSAALVGGVNIMLHHRTFVGCCAAKMLSVNGRCAAFDDSADGYCRGEGVGAVVLKRLSDAQADGDPVLAVIRGTAVNQDGRSASLTAPNGLAQEAVIRQALNVAGLRGRDVDYVECHGTGTALGDPVEVMALKNVLGEQREKPLVLGAVKTNIGHLEGAAGIVGLIKAIEVIRRREAPGNVHFKTLNPKIDLHGFDAIISAQPTSLGADSHVSLIAGVSSFGFGGTNAHVILESYNLAPVERRARFSYAPHFLPWHRLAHPFLRRQDELGFVATLSGEQAQMWQDHRVGDQVLLPAASHITLLGGAALMKQKGTITKALGVEVHEVIMPRPLVVSEDPTIVRCSMSGNQWSVQGECNGITEQFANCQSTRILTSKDQTHNKIDVDAVCNRCPSTDVNALYDILSHYGMQFGPGYRNLTNLHLGEEEAIACIEVHHLATTDRSLTLLHPATLDAGIQLLGLCGMKICGVCVPFNVRSARLFSVEDQPNKLWAYARITGSNSKSVEGTVTLFAESGEVFAILEGLNCRQVNVGIDTQVNDSLFENEWVAMNPSLVATNSSMTAQSLLLSRFAINNTADDKSPVGWQNFVIQDEDAHVLLALLSSQDWSTVVLVSGGSELDVALGLRLLQLVDSKPSLRIEQIVFVTAPASEADAGLWGLARTFRLERPEIRVRCIECTVDYVFNAISLISGYAAEDEFIINKDDVVRVPRLRRCNDIIADKPLSIHPDATYVISGGLGALGLVVAKFLVDQGAKHLLLLSRTSRTIDSLPQEILVLREQAQVECFACDISQEDSVLKARDWLLQNNWPAVRGVVHAAGVLTDGIIPNQSAEKLHLAFSSKVHGARNLRSAFTPPDFLVLFSSAAATFGSPGQGSYAAANATLDALAQSWSLAGEPVLSIQWGAWSDAGMAVRHGAAKRAEAAGFGAISNDLGIRVLERLLAVGKRGTVCVSPIDWSRCSLDMPLVSRFSPKHTASMEVQHTESHGYSVGNMLDLVRRAAIQSVGRPIADDEPLMANGLDSLGAVVLAQTLSQELGLSLGSVFALNHPTIREMAAALMPLLEKVETPTHSVSPVTSIKFPNLPQRFDEPIAIVSTACRLPGNVTSPEEFWEMLLAGTDCVTDVPSTRFDIDEVYDANPDAVGRSYTRRGAFMSEVDSFDHDFFGIPVAEARAMDPQQRLLLEVSYEAFYVAGYDKESLRTLPIGVFVGQMSHDWAHMNAEENLSDPYFGAGSSASITSNRISYLLGLTGPSMTLDTACSSSLVAVDLAVEKLRSGVCSAALVGGVNVMLHHRSFVGCCAAKMLSFNGRCATFDESADGYCRGEGVGAIVLKRLSDALADGNEILAVIRGTAVNQDGRSASLTAPNGLAQEAVIQQALDVAGLAGRDVDYVECHGTGTALGDPIEVEALKNVLGKQREKPVVLGAVKTNIGHLEGAAGVVGLIKTVEVLRRREAPGNVHFKTLNPKISLQSFDVIISANSTMLGRTGDKRPLVAGVSSFGFGGTNAHVVLESWHEPGAGVN